MTKEKTKSREGLRGGLDTAPATPRKQQRLARKLAQVVESCCSSEWAQDVQEGRADYPPPGMILSGCRVSTGGTRNPRGTIGTRRWTPPALVRVEDILDGMPQKEAEWYYHPPAIRYDHANPGEYDQVGWGQTEIAVDLSDKGPTLRMVRVEDWPILKHVCVRRGRRLISYEDFPAFPDAPDVASYVQTP